MRDYKKDVLLICKNRYNKDKYNSRLEAIRAYQGEWSGAADQYISDYYVLRFIYPIVSEFFKTEHYIEMIRERMVKGYEFNKINGIQTVVDYKYVCELFINQLCMLPVKNKNGWVIDISEYENCEHII